MATFKQYTKKDGSKAWMFKAYLGIDLATGKEVRTTRRGFKTKKEATLSLSRIKLDFEKGSFKQKESYTYQEIYDLWIKQYQNRVKESTFVKTEQMFRIHILPIFSKMKIEKISVLICQKAVDGWFGKLKKYTMVLNYASNVFDYAIALSVINDNPMKKVSRPVRMKKPNGKKLNYYSKEELLRFLDCLKNEKKFHVYAFFRLLAFSGMRKGEALALTWNDIDFTNQTISINKALARGIDAKLIIQTPKTENSIRKISMDVETIHILKQWRKHQKQKYLILGYNTMKPEQMVFSNENNSLLQPSKTRKWILAVQEKHSLKKITTHGLRHTHCSLLFEAGVPLERVQERLGHSDIQTTMNIYTHVTEKAKEQTAEQFAKYMNL